MKNTLFLAFLSLAIFVAYCSKSNDPETAACDGGVTEFALGEPFYLCYGINASQEGNPDFTLSFHTVYGDSRCPSDVNCFWQGVAAVGLTASLGQISISDTLLIFGLSDQPVADSMFFLNRKIKLLALDPYPTYSTPIPAEDYKLKLLVTQ